MNSTTVLIVLLADFTQNLKNIVFNKTQLIYKLSVSILLTFIFTITGMAIPGITIRSAWAVEASSLNQILSLQKVKTILVSASKNIALNIISGSSFFPDLNVVRTDNLNINTKVNSPTTNKFDQRSLFGGVPVYASLMGGVNALNGNSLARFDFFLTIRELNLVQINVNQPKELSQAFKYFQEGVKKAELGNYQDAVNYYTEALKLDNDFAEAFASRGRAYSELGDEQINLTNGHLLISELQEAFNSQKLALADYNMALKATPKIVPNPNSYVEPFLGRAIVYIKLGDFESAFNDFTEAIQRNPEFYDAYLGRAPIYLGMGDYKRSIQDLNSALSKHIDYPAAFIMRGSIWGESGQYEKAIEDFNKAIESKQEDAKTYQADAYYKRGLAYLNLREYQKAINDFKVATERQSNYVEAYYNWAVALASLGKYPEATKKCNEAIKLNPNSQQISHQSCIPIRSFNHSGLVAAIRSVAISPNGKIIASGSDDATIKLWNTDNGKELKTFSHHSAWGINNWIQSVAFSPDSKIIASGSSDQTVKVWNVSTGEEIQTLPMKHSDQIIFIAFSPDGQFIASGGNDKVIKLWDWKTGQNLFTFPKQSNYIKSLAFNPVGKVLASGSCDKNIKLWNWKTGEEIFSLQGHKECVRAVAFSPDGQILASGSEDNNIIIWDWRTGQPVNEFFGHSKTVTSLAFSADSKILASGSDDQTIRLWDVETGLEVGVFFGHQSYVESVAFSPDGKTLVSGSYDKTVKVWQIP